MTDTLVSSATREVVIGFGRPFVMIGERINPTGRKILAAEMAAGDFSRVEADARAQLAAGAHMLDVNAGIPLADEPAILAKAIQLVQSITDVPLSIDSSIVAALEAGGLLANLPHPNQQTYSHQRILVVNVDGYAYEVPCIPTVEGFFLVTAFPSRRATQRYLIGEEPP